MNLAKENLGCKKANLGQENFGFPFPKFFLTLVHSERPKLYTILAFLTAIGLKGCKNLMHMHKHTQINLNTTHPT